MEDEDRSTDASKTRKKRWTSPRPPIPRGSQKPSTSGGTTHVARTGPRPANAALGIGRTARRQGAAVPTATSGLTLVSAPVTMIATPRPFSYPIPTRGTSTTPRSPWHTTPTPPRLGTPQPIHTATSRTSGTTQGSARPGINGPQRGRPRRGLATPPLPSGWHPPVDRSAPGCIYPQLPPKGVGLGAHAAPGHGPAHPAPICPPHVLAPTSGGTLLPSVLWCAHMAPRHLVARGGNALRASVWLSPDTILSHRHATHLPHPTRAPPYRPPAFLTQPCLRHGYRTRASLLVLAATYRPGTYGNGFEACPAPCLRP